MRRAAVLLLGCAAGAGATNRSSAECCGCSSSTSSSSAGGGFYYADYTRCRTASSCGGGQCEGSHADLQFAMSDGPFWRREGMPDQSPKDPQLRPYCPACHGSQDVPTPSCPKSGSIWESEFCVCNTAKTKCSSAYLKGCCPSQHPCNIAKCEGADGGCDCGVPCAEASYCRQDRDHIDTCDGLDQALGYPGNGGQVVFKLGPCDNPAPPPGPPPSGCTDVGPDSHSCADQKGWGKCGEDWMKGYCCKTCFNCATGCGN